MIVNNAGAYSCQTIVIVVRRDENSCSAGDIY